MSNSFLLSSFATFVLVIYRHDIDVPLYKFTNDNVDEDILLYSTNILEFVCF